MHKPFISINSFSKSDRENPVNFLPLTAKLNCIYNSLNQKNKTGGRMRTAPKN